MIGASYRTQGADRCQKLANVMTAIQLPLPQLSQNKSPTVPPLDKNKNKKLGSLLYLCPLLSPLMGFGLQNSHTLVLYLEYAYFFLLHPEEKS